MTVLPKPNAARPTPQWRVRGRTRPALARVVADSIGKLALLGNFNVAHASPLSSARFLRTLDMRPAMPGSRLQLIGAIGNFRLQIQHQLLGLRARAADHHRLVGFALGIGQDDVAVVRRALEDARLAGPAHALEARAR